MNAISAFAGSEKVSPLAQLLEAGKTDTVYRDVYLERAQALLGALLPHSEYDLCSIIRTDERDGVVARFAVIRRERLMTG